MAEFLPEDGVPTELNFQDVDEDLPKASVDKTLFVDWLTEGCHDCDVARTLGLTWAQDLQGCGNETLGDFFDGLLTEYKDGEHLSLIHI